VTDLDMRNVALVGVGLDPSKVAELFTRILAIDNVAEEMRSNPLAIYTVSWVGSRGCSCCQAADAAATLLTTLRLLPIHPPTLHSSGFHHLLVCGGIDSV